MVLPRWDLERPGGQLVRSLRQHKQYYATKQNKHGHHHDRVILDDDVEARGDGWTIHELPLYLCMLIP
jgi:hypothetical protein